MIIRKSERQLKKMRKAGKLVAETLQKVISNVEPGVTTAELDTIAEELIRQSGAIPSFKGYRGFPAALCASINSQVVHGIPDQTKLAEGDILSLDVGAIVDGYHGDSAVTVPVGSVSTEVENLLKIGEEALISGIEHVRPDAHLSDVSHAIQSYVEAKGYSVVRDYAGHGIGRDMHEEPEIPNYGRPGRGPRLKEGMVLAIEPMVNQGSYHVRTAPDGWTVHTVDGKLSVHFEHTVAVLEGGSEVLTRRCPVAE